MEFQIIALKQVSNIHVSSSHVCALHVGTHNLQDLSIVNITSNTLCLQFTLVYGTTTHDVHMHLHSATDDYHIITANFNKMSIHTYKCFDQIPANNWTIYACDGHMHDNNCTANPAVILNNVHIPSPIASPSPSTATTMCSTSTTAVVLLDISTKSLPSSEFMIIMFRMTSIILDTQAEVYLIKGYDESQMLIPIIVGKNLSVLDFNILCIFQVLLFWYAS